MEKNRSEDVHPNIVPEGDVGSCCPSSSVWIPDDRILFDVWERKANIIDHLAVWKHLKALCRVKTGINKNLRTVLLRDSVIPLGDVCKGNDVTQQRCQYDHGHCSTIHNGENTEPS